MSMAYFVRSAVGGSVCMTESGSQDSGISGAARPLNTRQLSETIYLVGRRWLAALCRGP